MGIDPVMCMVMMRMIMFGMRIMVVIPMIIMVVPVVTVIVVIVITMCMLAMIVPIVTGLVIMVVILFVVFMRPFRHRGSEHRPLPKVETHGARGVQERDHIDAIGQLGDRLLQPGRKRLTNPEHRVRVRQISRI
jgi:flagellar biosynthesis/type III secretory pathway M-ring protein FliF/YscJ